MPLTAVVDSTVVYRAVSRATWDQDEDTVVSVSSSEAERAAREHATRQQAREHVSQRLALVSLVLWSLGVLAFMIVVFPGRPFRPSIGMMVALVMAGVAALPWLAYRPLVDRRLRGEHRP